MIASKVKTIDLVFTGYYILNDSVPAKPGIYCVYACQYNPTEKSVILDKLLYIGESSNVHSRISTHERYADWKKYLGASQVLCFSFAGVTNDRERAESGLIYMHKPVYNSVSTESFSAAKTRITTSGRNALLSSDFTVS